MDTKLIVSASPHVRSDETTRGLMANVIVALCRWWSLRRSSLGCALCWSPPSRWVVCVALEWLYCKLLKRPNPVGDLSAVVTGIILAMNVPIGMPLGQIAVGCVAAIIVTKQLFGGHRHELCQPRPGRPHRSVRQLCLRDERLGLPDAAVDQLASATPLQVADPARLNLFDLFMGIHGGVLGETCALAIVLGFVYLVVTKTISPAIPLSYVGSMFVFYLIATGSVHESLVEVLSGGLLFGAVFMATDYVTSPLYPEGQAAVRHLPGRRYICHPLLGQLHRGRLLRAAVHEPVGALHQ